MKAIDSPAIFENEGFRLTASGIEILPRAAHAFAGQGSEEDQRLVREWFEEPGLGEIALTLNSLGQ
jgi:hypothetical protein